MNMDETLQNIVHAFQTCLGEKLDGIYLHGSLAMGCYNPLHSDIDLLVLVGKQLSLDEKKHIIKQLIDLEDRFAVRIEMSMMLQSTLYPFLYPTPFELHYSRDHKHYYLQNENYLCANGKDYDLAAHIVVTLERGVTLFGEAKQLAFPAIDHTIYLSSIMKDIEDAYIEIRNAPVYYSLNLCRVLYYLRESVVSSKQEAGEWMLAQLADEREDLHMVVAHSLADYSLNKQKHAWDVSALQLFAAYMLRAIDRQLENIT
nr:aminoglycoside adenylyltransferase domain-containing protein [Priestia megaterium]